MTHYMKLNPEPFDKIASGKKTIELRLYDEKRKTVLPGDEIIFTHIHNPYRSISVIVDSVITAASTVWVKARAWSPRQPTAFPSASRSKASLSAWACNGTLSIRGRRSRPTLTCGSRLSRRRPR